MNRRSAIKGVIAVALFGGGVYFISDYKSVFSKPDRKKLLAYRSLIAEVTETIIPKTETPGAKEAGVPEMFISIVVDCADDKEVRELIYGLEKLDSHAGRHYGRPFTECLQQEREEMMHYYETAHSKKNILNKVRRKLLGTPFMEVMKYYTAICYCTSRIGATEALAYDPVPVHYAASTKLFPGQKAWATK